MKIEEIRFVKPPAHINEYLTHWTGSNQKDQNEAFEILSKIVTTKALKFSPAQISFASDNWNVKQQMICFTDTPIKQSYDHCEVYGYFGISFNKKKLIKYGANPVFYVVDKRKPSIQLLRDIHLSRNNESLLFGWVQSSIQPYATFYEREWRIVRLLPFNSNPSAEKYQGPFDETYFEGEIRPGKNEDEFFLMFNPNLIENIVVPKDYQSQAEKLITDNHLNVDLLIIYN